MTPTNSNRTSPCTNSSTSTCTIWTGQSIPSLGIVSGQTMTDTLYRIACQVVETTKELSLGDMDLSCLIDKTPILPENKNVRLILQLLLDNQCTLKTLIDQAGSNSSVTPDIVVNMKCLKVFDAFGNELPQDLNQALQSLINQTCTNVTDIATLKTTAQSLQDQITNLPIPPAYTEPLIVTCITPTAKGVSAQLPLVAQDYCSYKNAVGQIVDAQQAIARQPQGLNTQLGVVDGWILNPQNLSQSDNNQWLTISNLLSRISNIENNCCKATCKDIILAMQVAVNSDGDAISVTFSTFLGTSIPAGFSDTGDSVLTITDKNNNFAQYPILVSEDAKQGPFSFSGLDTSGVLTASVSASLSSGTLTCQKCVSKLFTPGSSCPVCLITGTGSTGMTTIVYKVPGSTTIQTLLVAPNSTGYIQKNAVIIGIDSSGDSGVSSDCINLSAPPYVCAQLLWATSGGTSTSVAWENYNTDIQAVAIGYSGTEFALSNAYKGDPYVISNAIAAATPPGLIKVVQVITENTAGVRYRDTILLKVPQNLIGSLYIRFMVADYGPVEIYATICTGTQCCPDTGTGSGKGPQA